jgi:hypothetical protein
MDPDPDPLLLRKSGGYGHVEGCKDKYFLGLTEEYEHWKELLYTRKLCSVSVWAVVLLSAKIL